MRSRRRFTHGHDRTIPSRDRCLALLRLEDRLTPSGINYIPPTNFLINSDLALIGPHRDSLDAGLAFVRDHAASFNATLHDLRDPVITNNYTDLDSGITHIYLRQRVFGLEVANANLAIGVAANGSVISAGGGFVYDLQNRLGSPRVDAVISPLAAVESAARQLDFWSAGPVFEINPVVGPSQSFSISAPNLAQDLIPARLHYYPTTDGSAALSWQLIMETLDSEHWYDVSVDAVSGQVLGWADWVSHADYHVVPTPNESPGDVGFGVISNPADPVASPFGWHDTNGVAGPEFTDTRGNNVDAYLDINADNVADATPRPDGGPNLDFSNFTYNTLLEPSVASNRDAALVNLFYMNNVLHDIHYQYGFTESAGNFQVNNYGKGGVGNDAVRAEAQDGSGTNNANMSTPVDGTPPRMQMYVWTNTSPARDSDMDNGVIIHEYGHGVSNRLTGGPSNSGALNSTQSGGMGEGWSDWHALMLLQRPTDTQNGGYGIGTYLLGQSTSGQGIRRFPYSYNMAINPLTWDAYGSSGTTPYGVARSTQVHRTGEIWASCLWDLNWLLINKYGYDPNLATGWSPTPGPENAGNKLALRLVMEGMKLQPANPTPIQARDAIIAADIALNGGRDLFEIWSAFARRGLGVNASTSGSTSTSITFDHTMPMLIAGVDPSQGAVVTTPPTNFIVTLSDPVNPTSVQAADLKVNGISATSVAYTAGQTSITFTYAASPVTGPGVQTVAIAAGAFERASDTTAVAAHQSIFYFDVTPLLVNSITPTPGSIVTVPLTTIDVHLNQAIDPASVQISDLSITQGKVTNAELINGDKTVRFTVEDLTNEGTVYAAVGAGAFADLQGNPNAAFLGNYILLDYSSVPFPTALNRRHLPGSLVYDGSFHANIGYAGDTDTITMNLDAGQLLDVVVAPNSGLRPRLTITGPNTNVNNSASTNGGSAQLTQIPITVSGTYNFAVTGLASTTGGFRIAVALNQGFELESQGGPTNDSLMTAQPLDSLMLDAGLGLRRAAVVGQTDTPSVPEIEPNNTPATANTVPQAAEAPTNYYQLMVSGALGGNDSQDYFNIGQLQVGDVITVSQSGLYSGRGTLDDAFVYLYRAGAPTTILASDDDGGPRNPATGGDSLIYRYVVTTTDTYYVRASRFGSSNTGTYQVGVLLENTGPAPTTGGNFVEESPNANGQISTAENASTSWLRVEYLSSASGTITPGDTDLFKYTFTAGDRISIRVNSNATLDPQTALLDMSGVELATDDSSGPYAIPGGFAAIFGYIIPATGDYFVRVTGAGNSTGAYTAEVYASSTPVPPVLAPATDYYSINLSAGQVVSAAIYNISPGDLDIEVLDSGGATLANGADGLTNLSALVANVVAPTTGTCYIRVTGPRNVDYQLIAVTGGTFDAEANNSFAAAQVLGANRSALGMIDDTDDWYQFTAAAGETIVITTATPSGGPGEFVNLLDPAVDLLSPSNTLITTDDNSAGDGRNAKLTHVATVPGTYRLRLRGVGGTIGEYVVRAEVVGVPPPRVNNVTIGDGSTQRSRINQLVVDFDQPVTLPTTVADAFQLVRHGGGTVTLNAVASSTPNTSVTITFAGGSIDFGSLADGRYDLTVLAAAVSSVGGPLDGDGNGVGGDNFVLASATAPNAPTNIFRLFGDANGDGFVSATDFNAFRLTFGGAGSIFDFNDDDATTAADFNEFRLRYGASI